MPSSVTAMRTVTPGRGPQKMPISATSNTLKAIAPKHADR